ncbi:MAG TPA: hypothetical protein VNB49_14660, partial [Candidatus Dormibacteraeota bacterium]|nr:hypothetical protein [Candidatus Dormibacteraeota bacterium]
DLCKGEGIFVSSVRVGSVEIKIAGRVLGKTKPAADESEIGRSLTEEEASSKKKLMELRKRSQDQFGKVLPDEVLLQMEGAL